MNTNLPNPLHSPGKRHGKPHGKPHRLSPRPRLPHRLRPQGTLRAPRTLRRHRQHPSRLAVAVPHRLRPANTHPRHAPRHRLLTRHQHRHYLHPGSVRCRSRLCRSRRQRHCYCRCLRRQCSPTRSPPHPARSLLQPHRLARSLRPHLRRHPLPPLHPARRHPCRTRTPLRRRHHLLRHRRTRKPSAPEDAAPYPSAQTHPQHQPRHPRTTDRRHRHPHRAAPPQGR